MPFIGWRNGQLTGEGEEQLATHLKVVSQPVLGTLNNVVEIPDEPLEVPGCDNA